MRKLLLLTFLTGCVEHTARVGECDLEAHPWDISTCQDYCRDIGRDVVDIKWTGSGLAKSTECVCGFWPEECLDRKLLVSN